MGRTIPKHLLQEIKESRDPKQSANYDPSYSPVNITLETVEKYRVEHNNLGELRTEVPKYDAYKIALEDLYRHITRTKFFAQDLQPKDIATVVIFGSILYKAVEPPTTLVEKRFIPIVGKKHKMLKQEKRTAPNDLDIMIITNNPFSGEESYKGETERAMERKEGSSFYREKKIRGEYGYHYGNTEMPLDLSYRSKDKFIQHVINGTDDICTHIFNCGVPLFNTETFYNILKEVPQKAPKRWHEVVWKEVKKGELHGQIVETDMEK